MTEQEKRDELRQKLTEAVTDLMRHNDLDTKQQLEVLAEMFLNMLRLHGEFNGEDPSAFAENFLGQMLKINNPDTRWRELPEHVANFDFSQLAEFAKKMKGFPTDADAVHHAASMYFRKNEGSANRPHRGGRIVQPDPANSWLRVFPTPLTAAQLLRTICPHDDNGDELYDQKHIASKLQGVLLTSMPEADRQWIKAQMKAHGLTVVSGPKDHRLCYVVFGAGEQASTKTGIILDRMAHGEIIEGIYFEHFMDVLDELTDMAELHDADQYAKQAPEDADPEDDDLPF